MILFRRNSGIDKCPEIGLKTGSFVNIMEIENKHIEDLIYSYLIGLVMVKILHEDIPAFSGQGIHGTIDFLLEFLILQISQRMGIGVYLQLLYRQ